MKTIAVIGAESTGKSTLCAQLAEHFGCNWIAEYARTYVENLQRPYTYDDVEQIARHQVEELKQAQASNNNEPFLFIDTDLIITKVWFEHVYKREPDWLNKALNEQKIDFYLLCLPDIAAEADPVRENLDKRDFFTAWYERGIQQTGIPYAKITGQGNQRTQNAITAINASLFEIV